MVAVPPVVAQRHLGASADRAARGTPVGALGRDHDLEVRRVAWDDKQPVFRAPPPPCATYLVLKLAGAHSLPQRDRARNAAMCARI